MSYNANYYTNDKAKKRDDYFSDKLLFYKNGIDTNKFFFDYILDAFKQIRKEGNCNKIKILDLGAGTGYVSQVLCQLSNENFEITGVDLSEQMINLAKQKNKNKRVNFIVNDNNNLPFRDNCFDIVTNKLTTQFDLNEFSRVLKSNGFFVFKEYGVSKGFKEIFGLFKKRYVKVKKRPVDYCKELNKMGFQDVILRKFLIKREYKIDEIKKIFDMANIIKDFNGSDLKIIRDFFGEKLSITSDPFIIYAKK